MRDPECYLITDWLMMREPESDVITDWLIQNVTLSLIGW